MVMSKKAFCLFSANLQNQRTKDLPIGEYEGEQDKPRSSYPGFFIWRYWAVHVGKLGKSSANIFTKELLILLNRFAAKKSPERFTRSIRARNLRVKASIMVAFERHSESTPGRPILQIFSVVYYPHVFKSGYFLTLKKQ